MTHDRLFQQRASGKEKTCCFYAPYCQKQLEVTPRGELTESRLRLEIKGSISLKTENDGKSQMKMIIKKTDNSLSENDTLKDQCPTNFRAQLRTVIIVNNTPKGSSLLDSSFFKVDFLEDSSQLYTKKHPFNPTLQVHKPTS